MAEPHVISALRAKRAELSGDLIAAQKRLEKIRDDLDAVDRTLRVFDPRQHPEKIRPIVKRKGDRMFGYGECTRAILNALLPLWLAVTRRSRRFSAWFAGFTYPPK